MRIKEHPEMASNLLEKAKYFIRQNMLHAAGTALDEARIAANDDTDISIEIANAYYDIDRTEDAIDTIKTSIEKTPDRALLHIEIGTYQKLAGDYPDAINSFKNAINLEPYNAATYISLANILTSTGNISDAIKNYAIALKYSPDNKGSWMILASLKESQGDIEGCANAYKAIHELDKSDIHITLKLADYMAQLGHYDAAENALRNALAYDSGDINHHIHLVEVLLISGKHADALQSNSQAIDLFPDMDTLGLQRANIFERMGDFDKAFIAIKPLIENKDITMKAALAFAKMSPFLGMTNEARELLTYIIDRDKLAPPPDDATKALQWLHDSENNI